MRKQYRATLRALNSDCIGRQAHGFANFEVTDDDALQIRIEMFNTPADMNHMAVLGSSMKKKPNKFPVKSLSLSIMHRIS